MNSVETRNEVAITSDRTINRRDFLKYTIGGVAAIVVGSRLAGLTRGNPAFAATQIVEFHITDAIK